MDSNLESFSCLWLDRSVNSTEDNIQTQKELRQVINHLRTFDNISECEQCIRQITKEKVVLIVAGRAGLELVPRIHDLPQFSTCYVFCQDREGNEEWAQKYSKVNGVFVDRSKLVAKIEQDQQSRNKFEDSASISVITSGSATLQARNAVFMWFQLFIEVLLRMHHKSNDRQELLNLCKTNYKGNQRELKMIEEFDNSYKPDSAIWWYTRQSCFYRMMNKALRVQDFDTLFALRFFITDIAKQIKIEHEKFIRTSENRNIIRVYRGQMIGTDELELMKKSIGEFLSMNSFFSTSRSRSTAARFARSSPVADKLHRILFEIEIDPHLQTKPFTDVAHISYHKKEDEVLIMLGALFRIEKVDEDKKEDIWVVRMSLASEEDFHLKEIFSYMKNTIGDDTDLDSLGKILSEMGEYAQAKKCYKRMLEEANLVVGRAELGLGIAHMDCYEDTESLGHLEQALNIRQRFLGQDHAAVAECYRNIGSLHWYVRHDYNQALSNLKHAVQIQEAKLSSDSIELAKTYGNIATTYGYLNRLDLALEYNKKSIMIKEKILPVNHPKLAASYNNIGTIYERNKNYSKALEYYEKSIEISRKILPPGHLTLTRTEQNIRTLRDRMKE
ncbi:unnamed protein product [Rotaria magnacalcarata]|uniref:ADP ribosyltransferase domain-containing protein n=2 Tax=Rotaria magnacalcarata TaxID=392030 RepID=A0A819ZYX1_9BILA|nr:unnamed protein product [Rotaria magnacalcarata]CAF4177808.1 unnamed protein product [Rotaria magnacalcarata]